MRRGITFSGVAVALAFAVAAPAAVAKEEAQGQLRCSVDAKVKLSEGLRLGLPFQTGTLRSPEPGTVVCSGAIGDHGFANARGTIKLSGTFGDGPVSAASGGATCTHNDGYIDAKLTLPVADGEVTLLAEDVYWLRSAMAVIKAAGFLGHAPMTLEAVINHRDGSCTAQSPIFVAGFTGVIAAAGRMTYGFDPGA